MTRSTSAKPIALLTLASLLLSSAAFAVCDGPNRPNVILFIADDLGWSDLPFFTPEITWTENRAKNTFHHQTWRPDLNRSAARLQHREGVANTIITIDAPGSTPTTNPTAIRTPLVYKTPIPGQGCGSLAIDPAACTAREDALEGFGGLRKLAEGAVFSRFYSASAVCSPSRASIYTGRHVNQHESKSVGSPMASHQVTIAEYLRQGCSLPEKCWRRGNKLEACQCFTSDGSCPSSPPCYTTGFIGKWHIGGSGEDGNAPWTQGFDEFVGSLGGHRGYFSEEPLVCSPAKSKYCKDSSTKCNNDGDCTSNPAGAVCEVRGLYVGPNPDGFNDCSPSQAEYDPECCFAKNENARGKYHVAGRKADRDVTCNDNSGLARTPPAKRCVDGGEVGDLCQSDADCETGTCSGGPVCEGGTKEGTSCASDKDCGCALGEQNCRRGRCTVGCNFAVRVHRDLAKDFIDRHAARYFDDGRPFFLVVSFNAVHASWKGTERAKRHYTTIDPATGQPLKPRKPSAPVDYWAILEEMDAAVGQIVKKLEDTKDDDDPQHSLAEDTLVLFVSDNGRPRGSYGNPVFKGGKATMFEDGIRLGLLARPCDTPGLGLDDYVGGHVDIFPTIAEAAGFPVSNFGTTPVLRSCKKTGSPCSPSCPTGDQCVQHELLGTSFYDLVNRSASVPPATHGSEFVFAKLDAGNAAISRPGYYATNMPQAGPSPLPSPFPGGVCGFEGTRVTTPISADVFRAGSCLTCELNAQGDEYCGEQKCRVLGKVCVPADDGKCSKNESIECDTDSDCNGDGPCYFRPDQIGDRCGTCGTGKVCRETHVECGECVPASWKLKRRDDTQLSMWDLATDPEEEEPLDCLDYRDGQGNLPVPLQAIRDDLNQRLEDYEDLKEYTVP